jgi:hypothetical protein
MIFSNMEFPPEPRLTSKVKIDVENDEPEFVDFFNVVNQSGILLGETILEFWHSQNAVPSREHQALYRWVALLGTLASEMATASCQLALLEMPRAMYVLDRSIFEYSVRLQWLHRHQDEAVRLLDSMPKWFWKEIPNAQGVFSDKAKADIIANYETWAADHPELNGKFTEASFTDIAKEIRGDNFDSEWFHYYAHPSIIAHGKPHAITDVLWNDGTYLELHQNSRMISPIRELGKVASLILELIVFIVITYQMDARKWQELNSAFGETLLKHGHRPYSVPVKRNA